jgi:plastocyanin
MWTLQALRTSTVSGRVLVLTIAIAPAGAIGCGSGTPSSPSSETTVTITSSGVSPTEVHIAVGGRVTFFNNDSRPHAMSSDPIQVHTDCPPINDVGFLNPGQRGSTGAMNVKRTCGFHDHTNENDPIFKGRIVVD